MAVVFSNNATTVLSSNITNSATSIAVQDGSVFPTLSGTDYFYATLQDPGNTKREIVKVTARSGNTLTVTRAVDGSSASAFSANDAFELRLNAAALNDAVNSGTADLELNSFTGDGSEVDFTLSMEALEANTLVYIDGVYQNKTAYSISGYVLTFSAAPDNGAAIEVTTATVAPIQESTDFLLNQFTGDGSDTTFTLSSSPEENQTTVFISGVYQSKSNYSISGTTLTFSTAPPASSSIEVMVARTVVYGIGTPSNDTVSTAKIVDGAVTPAKLSLTYATETFVGTAVSNLVDSSPAALDTLNELAAALGDDPNFATTVTNSIALKAPLASPSFTGNVDTSGLLKVGTNDTEYANNYIRFKPTGAAYIDHSTVGQAINFRLSNASSLDKTVMTLTSAGNVGIGTSTIIGSAANRGVLTLSGASSSFLTFGTGSTRWGGVYSSASNTIFLSDSISTFETGGVERMRIDSAGNTTFKTSAGHLSIEALGGGSVKLNSNGSMGMNVPSGYAYEIDVGGSEVMRIDSAGNLLVGKSSADNTTAGTRIHPLGYASFTIANDYPIIANRLSSDGDIAVFRKDGATVGSIGTNGGRLSIGSGDVNLNFNASANSIYPISDTAGTLSDAIVDVGASTARFKDLYLSGTAKSQAVELEDIKAKDTNGLNLQTSDGQKRVILDNSGNLLVGKTTTGTSGAGTVIRAGGELFLTRAGDVMNLNRLTSDGDIAVFRKDGAAVGTIGTESGNVFLNSVSTGLLSTVGTARYKWDADQFYPNGDNAKNLGATANRFKDLYLSGGVYLGGTGAANLLDDYEEGGWTPACTSLTIGTIVVAAYTKIGRLVTINMYIENTVNQGTTGNALFTGLPFVCVGGGWSVGSVSIAAGNANIPNLHVRVMSGLSQFELKKNNDTTCAGNEVDAGHIILTVSYLTAA